MKACVLDRPAPMSQRPLRLVEVADPVPAADEILVEVTACGVCRTDLHVVTGDLETRRSPVIPGHQAVGKVIAVPAAAAAAPANAAVGRPGVPSFRHGDRVGVAWLHRTCGACRFCRTGRENLCERPEFTGWTVDGGFAGRIVVPAAFAYPIPAGFDDVQAAPLLCAGIIGFRALRLCGLDGRWAGARLGIYGFGAAGHVAIQIARGRGADVYVCTRDRSRHQTLAAELGAAWVGDAAHRPPVLLDAAVIFAPAGDLVPAALAALDKGGALVLGGIHMSPIPSLEYPLLYGERLVRSVANNTREDGREFLQEAARLPVRTQVQTFPLDQANEALQALERDAIRGAAVLQVA